MKTFTLALAFAILGSSLPAAADDESPDDESPEADSSAEPSSDDEPIKPSKRTGKKKRKKARKQEQVVADEPVAETSERTPPRVISDDHAPPRVTIVGELLGAAPVDQRNRLEFSRGGGGSLDLDVYITPTLGLTAGATLLMLGPDLAMSSTRWVAGHIGPRLHFAHMLLGPQTHHDGWVDAHVSYGTSGGIRAPGFDVGAAFQWELASALRVGPVVRYQFGADPSDGNAQLFTVGLAVGYGGRTRVTPLRDPDRDGDGIADSGDLCPDEVPGARPDAERAGCPSLDGDGDGVLDATDECPERAIGETADPARAGCPLDDRDGDDIGDGEDKCPTTAGVPNVADPARHGCPKLARVVANKIEILEQVFFETDSATIKSESANVLEAVAAVVKTLDGARIRIEGHTDDQGSNAYNLDLSRRRARAVAQWLIQNAGIDAKQLTTEGFGKSRPIVSADGDEAARAQNRRVEFVLVDAP